jgi:protein phosphatase 1 regulatory subunit 37
MMATGSSPASSSAVTIPTPGKSILKRPPPPPQSILSRLSRLLPTQSNAATNGSTDDDAKTLKRAHFILPQMSTVYPILAANPPYTLAIKEEKKIIEEKEAERRKRVVRGNSVSSPNSPSDIDEWWSMDKVESFYRECCAGREEKPDPAISAALKVST